MTQGILNALLFGIIASFLNATTAALVKLTGPQVPTSVILFARFSMGLIFLLLWLGWNKQRPLSLSTYRTAHIKLHLLRAACGLTSFGCLFYAIVHIPMVDAILLNASHPLFVPFIVAIFLGIPLAHRLWPGIMLGFAGVLLVLEPGREVFQMNSLIGLCSGFFSASAMVITRRLNHSEPVHVTMFYYFVFSVALLSLIMPFTWHAFSLNALWLLLLISFVSVLYQAAFITTLRHAPARVVTPIFYLAIVFGGFYDWLGWGALPALHVWLGSILVFVGASATLLAGRRLVQSANNKPANA